MLHPQHNIYITCSFGVFATQSQCSLYWSTFPPGQQGRAVSARPVLLDVGADAVGDHLPHGDRADKVELLVEAGQVHGQFQVLLLHSPVADPAAAVAQPLWVLQVEGQWAASAGRADRVWALTPARRWCGGVAGRPVGLSEECGRVGLWVITIALWRWRRRGSRQSQGVEWRHGGEICFLLFPLLRLLPLTAVILEQSNTGGATGQRHCQLPSTSIMQKIWGQADANNTSCDGIREISVYGWMEQHTEK